MRKVDHRARLTPPQPSPEGEGAMLDADYHDQSPKKALPSGEGLGGVSSREDHPAHLTPPQPSPEGEGATFVADPHDQSLQKALPSGEGLGGVSSHQTTKLTEASHYEDLPTPDLYRLTTTPEMWKHLKLFARQNRKEQTPAESKFWDLVRSKRLGKRFRRQHAIGDFIVDFVCLDLQLVVEIDGEVHLEQREYDEWRSSVLRDLGFHVVRFTNQEVLSDSDRVISSLKEVMQSIQKVREGSAREKY